MKVFYRVKRAADNNIIPYNYNIYNALDGALQLGLETISYFNVNEIYDSYELGDIVLDGIDQVNYCLKKFNIIPDSNTYPDILKPYLGREVWIDTIDHINRTPELWGNFVKPIKDKVFTGKVINGPKDLIGCGSCYENYEVLVSKPLDFIYECRGFIYYDELIDLRPYKGDYKYMKYMDTDLISEVIDTFKTWEDRPMACSLDFGIIREKSSIKNSFIPNYHSVSMYGTQKTSDKLYNKNNEYNKEDYVYKTVLIESNLPYSLGCYGLFSINYFKMISAYISQISGIKDECKF